MKSHNVCYLYRHFDENQILLYVGVSLNPIVRLTQHRNKSKWFHAIRKIEIEVFKSRKEALKAETKAIEKEKPIYNKVLSYEKELKAIQEDPSILNFFNLGTSHQIIRNWWS